MRRMRMHGDYVLDFGHAYGHWAEMYGAAEIWMVELHENGVAVGSFDVRIEWRLPQANHRQLAGETAGASGWAHHGQNLRERLQRQLPLSQLYRLGRS